MVIPLSKLNAHRRTFLTSIVLILLGYISFTHVENKVAWDLLRYMTYALNIFNGNGYVDMDGSLVFFRGPVFPLMIAMSYWLFGVTALSALGVVKLFCVLNPVLLYYFGKKIFSEKVGLTTALLIISSYSISFWSFQFIDAIWPFFVILHCYCLYIAFEQDNNKIILFVLSGLFLGIAFLTKEVSLLFFPLGIVMFGWIKEYQNKKNFLGVSISIFATIIIILPWALYLQYHDALSFLWGTGGPVVLGDITNTISQVGKGKPFYSAFFSQLNALKGYAAAFVYFYSGQTNTVTVNFSIAPLFLVSWCFVIFHAFRGHKGCKILVVFLLLFLPIIYFIGKNHWRFGQVLFIMLISYAALLYSMSCLVDWICRALNVSTLVAQVLFISFVFVLIVVQVFVHSEKDFGYAKFFQKTTSYHLVRGESGKQAITGSFSTPYLAKTVEKLSQISKSNEAIMSDSFLAARKIFFQFEGKRNVFAVPMLWCRKNKVILGNPPENRVERALYVSSNNLPLEPQYRLYILFESQLIDLLHVRHIKYVILSPLFRPLEEYFAVSDNYEKVLRSGPRGENDKTYYLYRVKEEPTSEGKPPFLYSDQFVLTLNKLRNADPQRYQYLRNIFLYGIASLTEKDVATMLDSIIKIPSYHKDLGDRNLAAGNIRQAIQEYEEAVRLDPENKRYMKALAQLYYQEGISDQAITSYLSLIRIDPGNAVNYRRLAQLYRKNGDVGKAIKEFEKFLNLQPESAWCHESLGELYRLMGKKRASIEQYVETWRLQPGKAKLARILGDLYREIGELGEALVWYQKALALNPDKAYYNSLVGAVYRELGEYDKALYYFETAVQLNPTKNAYIKLLVDLQKENRNI